MVENIPNQPLHEDPQTARACELNVMPEEISEVSIVLKRAAKLFAVSTALVAVVQVFLVTYYSCKTATGGICRWISEQISSNPNQEEPVTYVSETWYFGPGWTELIVWLLLYFILCIALAWCWSWVKLKKGIT